jgi:hypothetical protein
VIQEERLFVYNMQNVVVKHFNIIVAPVRSRGNDQGASKIVTTADVSGKFITAIAYCIAFNV